MFEIKSLPFSKEDIVQQGNVIPDATISFLQNNQYTCRCCGLVSRPHRDFPDGYIEVFEHDEEKFCLCSMCMQSQYVARSVGGMPHHGLIIYCPTLSQGEIVRLAQMTYIARLRKNKFYPEANNLIEKITTELISPVEKIIPGFSSGGVQEFAEIYEYLSPKIKSSGLLNSLRYWPNEMVYANQIKFWDKAAFNNVSEELDG